MNKLKYLVIFTAGAAIGSFATWQYTKTKYAQIAQDEIDSVKEVFMRYKKDIDALDEDPEKTKAAELASKAKEKPNVMEYAKILNKEGYKDYSDHGKVDTDESEDEEEDIPFMRPDQPADDEEDIPGVPKERPYIISPEHFGEEPGYNYMELNYFADGVLAYDDNIPLSDEEIDRLVGHDALNHFGEYEDDSVCVRNDQTRCDYQILIDQRDFEAVLRLKPHQIGD